MPESSNFQPNSSLQNLCARSASADGNSTCTMSPAAIFSPRLEVSCQHSLPSWANATPVRRRLKTGAKAVAERGDLGLAAAGSVFPLVHARAPELARGARVAGDDVDVVMGHVVEGEGVDVLGALFLERLRQARDDQRQRAGLLVGAIGQAASVPLRVPEKIAEIAVDHRDRRVRNQYLLVLVQHLAHEHALALVLLTDRATVHVFTVPDLR